MKLPTMIGEYKNLLILRKPRSSWAVLVSRNNMLVSFTTFKIKTGEVKDKEHVLPREADDFVEFLKKNGYNTWDWSKVNNRTIL